MAKKQNAENRELFGGTTSDAAAARSRLRDVEDELEKLAKDMQKLHSVYELYFMGIERTEPIVSRDQIRRRIRAIRDVKNKTPRVKFKFQDLQSRFISF